MTTLKKLKTSDSGEKGKLAVLMLFNSALGIIGILLILLTTINTIRIANKPAPSLVQLTTGEAIQVKPTDKNQRENAVIENFVVQSLTGLFTWDGKIPPQTPEEALKPTPDPGVSITDPKTRQTSKIATSTYEASFALNPELREPFFIQHD